MKSKSRFFGCHRPFSPGEGVEVYSQAWICYSKPMIDLEHEAEALRTEFYRPTPVWHFPPGEDRRQTALASARLA